MADELDLEILQAACSIAGVDGSIHKNEKRMLQILAAKIDLDEPALDELIRKAREDPAFYQKQLVTLRANPEKAVRILASVAIADHQFLPEERILIRHLAREMGLSDARCDQIFREAEQAMKKARDSKAGGGGR